ncbi:SymE family type I addiction module toxin, partial [Pectobacterium versatile]|uniref:SymE family type I addiction module toxin n=1 Tax=Pectobacterium versatile TaxID=2488639 RepID=UPI0037F6929F
PLHARYAAPSGGQGRHTGTSPTVHYPAQGCSARQWLKDAGFPTGQPLRLRIMPGCIAITMQDIHELWGNLQALSIAPFDERAATQWLNRFPGGLNVEGAR